MWPARFFVVFLVLLGLVGYALGEVEWFQLIPLGSYLIIIGMFYVLLKEEK